MTQRRVEDTRVHFWAFSPVSVNLNRFAKMAIKISPRGAPLKFEYSKSLFDSKTDRVEER